MDAPIGVLTDPSNAWARENVETENPVDKRELCSSWSAAMVLLWTIRGARLVKTIAAVLFALCVVALPALGKGLTDAQIKQALIQQSLASYPGNCPCPYNVDRRGHACGRRSAYSRPGGYAPLCYARDITGAMVADYRRTHGQ